jgi:CO/xanthine dehydrogenase Mo-binding subunit
MAEHSDRVDARSKVTGKAAYTEDLPLPSGTLECAILRSPHAHARLGPINIERALQLRGVVAVCTSRHLGDKHGSQPFLAVGKVRYQGEVVAGVAAETLAIAQQALELIAVDYEELPGVFDVREALKPDAPQVHEERGSNFVGDFKFGWGDVGEGFKQADRVFEGSSYFFPTIFHYPIENIGVCLAEARGDRIEVLAPIQHPFGARREIAEVFGVEPDRVLIRIPYVGGGFGSKELKNEHLVAIWLARETGRPVRLVASSEDSFTAGVRHSMVWRARTGVKSDGTIVAQEVELLVDKGAYGGAAGASVRGASLAWGPYRIPNFRVVSKSYFTNKIPATAFRAVGRAQTTWGYESHYDVIARELDMDPMEFRLKNFYRRGDRVAEGTSPFDSDMDDLLNKAVNAIGWDGKSDRVGRRAEERVNSTRVRGRGIATGFRHGYSGTSSTWVTVTANSKGTIKVLHTGIEIGQGLYTVLTRVTAQTLGIPEAQVQISHPDTTLPFFPGVGSSRCTVSLGKATERACDDLKRELMEVAARVKGGRPEDWRFEAGRLLYGEQSFLLGEIVAALGAAVLVMGKGSYGTPFYNNPWRGIVPHWNLSAAAAEVEVDLDTGEVRLLKYSNVTDVGKAIHPLSCKSQLDGGAIMGLGNTFYEEMIYRDGQLLNASPLEYRLPLVQDLPEKFLSLMVENEDGPGPNGSKAVAQTALSPIAPAVGNAIYEAIGVRLTELPITAEKVLRALGKF